MIEASLPPELYSNRNVNDLFREVKDKVRKEIRELNSVAGAKEKLYEKYRYTIPEVKFADDIATQREYKNNESLYRYSIPFKGNEGILQWYYDGTGTSGPDVKVRCDGYTLSFNIRDESKESNRKREAAAVARINDYIEKMSGLLTQFNSELETIIDEGLEVLDKKLKEKELF